MGKELTAREAGAMGGRARWAKVAKNVRSAIMKKVRSGKKARRTRKNTGENNS